MTNLDFTEDDLYKKFTHCHKSINPLPFGDAIIIKLNFIREISFLRSSLHIVDYHYQS